MQQAQRALGCQGTNLMGVERERMAGLVLVFGVQLLITEGWSQCMSVMKSSLGMSRKRLHEPALQGVVHLGLQHVRMFFQLL